MFLSPLVLNAQISDLYIPINILHAYRTGTRSSDGKPGSYYWQNRAEYNIKVNLDPNSNLICGEESIYYFNNSPDSLKEIVVRLYQDIFKMGSSRDVKIDVADLHDGTKLLSIILDGEEVSLDKKNITTMKRGTNLFIPLKRSLEPNQELLSH